MVVKNWILILIFCFQNSASQGNVLQNADFEQPFTNDDWRGNGADITQDEDSYTGVYSCRVSNTREDWSGVLQYVDLQPNTHYLFSMMIKLLNQSDDVLGEKVEMNFNYDENGESQYKIRAQLPNLRVDQGWQNISADFYVGSNFTNIRAIVRLTTPYVSYLVDTASLTVLRTDPNWRQSAEQRIEQIRKNDINLHLRISEEFDPNFVRIQMNQTSHAFPFGSAVKHSEISEDTEENVKYQNCYYENFNWAVIENALKWKQMERNRTLVNTARMLLDAGIPVHAIGAQSHLDGTVDIALVDVIETRLERLAGAGLPIWITELDVENPDKEARADGYDDVVTLYFSHPNVHGILLWGFHDEHHSKPDAALFEGPNYTPNAAGLRWQEMMNERWRTKSSFSPTSNDQTFSVRGFYGNYEIEVFYDGVYLRSEYFTMEDGSAHIYIYVN